MIDFGMTQQEFRARYFEKNYCLLRGALPAIPFTWNDVDEVLHRIDPVPPFFNVFKGGPVPAEEFIDTPEPGSQRRLNKPKFYELLGAGASVVMNRLESTSLAAQRLCQQVSRFAGHVAISNAYLSFGGKGTFGKHWDTHDVFVIQLLGKKRWQVFAPTFPNPLSFQTSGGHEQSCPMQPILDCELSPGDVLYLPRGWWHQAIPGAGGSFHLSVGTYAPTAMEFLQWLCHFHLSNSEAARVGLTGDTQQLDVDAIVARLGGALRDPQQLAAFHRTLKGREPVSGEFDLQSLAVTPNGEPPELPDDTTIHLNSCYPIAFNGPHLVINGAELRLESLRRMIVLHLDKVQEMTLRSLYACAPAVPRGAIRSALIDLAQFEILTLRRPT
jgi:ribosomal protein L16 Arg81 hydroxylase